MIMRAEQRGDIGRDTLIEATSGNTGIALGGGGDARLQDDTGDAGEPEWSVARSCAYGAGWC